MDNVYAAFYSTPDYSGRGPTLLSLHCTLEGAIKALYPDGDYDFRKWEGEDIWEGPDGFGLIKLLPIGV